MPSQMPEEPKETEKWENEKEGAIYEDAKEGTTYEGATYEVGPVGDGAIVYQGQRGEDHEETDRWETDKEDDGDENEDNVT